MVIRKYSFYILSLFLVILASCAKDDSGSDSEEQTADNEITAFLIQNALNPDKVVGNYSGVISDNTIEVCVPTLTEFKDLIVSFITTGKKVTVGGTIQQSNVTKNDFSKTVTYTVEASNGSKRNYKVTVCNTGLPTVYVTTPGSKAITSKTEWIDLATMKIVNEDGTEDLIADSVSIRGRGNTTWGFPKKAYAVKLNKKEKVLGMKKHKRWCLLANYMDRTLLRNDVSFEIAHRTSLEWSPSGKFVEVVLNGKFVGNYYLCEQIKIDKNRLPLNEMSIEDTEGEAITGGYLMELDVNYDEVNKFKSPKVNLPYNFKAPDEDAINQQQIDYMYNYISKLEDLLTDDTELANRSYTKMLDVDSWIDYWLVEELAGNGELAHPKSGYAYKDKNGLLKAGPVWDFDWGTYRSNTSSTFRSNKGLYYPYLFKDPEFVKRVKERWAALKPVMQTIPTYIDEEAAKIKKSEPFNTALWPINSRTTNKDESMTFDEAIESMKKCYNTKFNYIDTEISKM